MMFLMCHQHAAHCKDCIWGVVGCLAVAVHFAMQQDWDAGD